MAEKIVALSGYDVSEILSAIPFFEVKTKANIPLELLEFEGKKMLDAIADYRECTDNQDIDKDNLLRARILVHLRKLQATANDLFPDELPF